VRLGIDASNLRRGGGLTHIVALLRAAEPKNHGFEQVVIWGDSQTLALVGDAPWLMKRMPKSLEKGSLSRFFCRLFELGPLARKEECDVLFVPGGSFLTKFRPIVTMSRNMLPFQWRELMRYRFSTLTLKYTVLRFIQSNSYRNASGIIFLNHWVKEAVERVAGPFRGLSAIIPHGVDSECINAPKPQRPISDYDASTPFKLLYVSIIDVYKHQWNVARAVIRLRAKGFPIVLDLAGPAYSPSLRRVKCVLKKYRVEYGIIQCIGRLDRKEVSQRLRKADLFVFASSCENMPNILLEAMAAGLPIACSDRGPMPATLQDGGIYFNPENTASIEQALEGLLLNPRLRAEKAALAYRYSQNYSWKKCANDTFGFLAQVAQACARPASDAATPAAVLKEAAQSNG
jgi:glycosyltransferase involved in cell wall biosynthesis